MSKSVTVIIPAYNGQQYLKESIESALSQTCMPSDIILVDDGSKDDTAKIARHFGNNVHYIYQDNKGAAGAYNTGISNATGEYIAFLEQDDLWMPDKNAAQLDFLASHNEYGLVFCPVELLYAESSSKNYSLDYQAPAGEYSFVDFFSKNQILNCSSVMIKSSVLQETGPLREDMHLAFDYDLWLRIAHDNRIYCLDKPLVKYRIHADNVSRDSNELMAATGNLKTLAYWLHDSKAIASVGKAAIRRRVAKAYRRVAWDYTQLGNREDEIKHWWGAVSVDPLHIVNWRFYLWHRISPQMRKKITWHFKRLERILY